MPTFKNFWLNSQGLLSVYFYLRTVIVLVYLRTESTLLKTDQLVLVFFRYFHFRGLLSCSSVPLLDSGQLRRTFSLALLLLAILGSFFIFSNFVYLFHFVKQLFGVLLVRHLTLHEAIHLGLFGFRSEELGGDLLSAQWVVHKCVAFAVIRAVVVVVDHALIRRCRHTFALRLIVCNDATWNVWVVSFEQTRHKWIVLGVVRPHAHIGF